MRLDIERAAGSSLIHIRFADQRLATHSGMIVWPHVLHQKRLHRKLSLALPCEPTSPNVHMPAAIALGYLGAILAGADKLSRVAWLQSDPAVVHAFGIEAVEPEYVFAFLQRVQFQKLRATRGLHP